MSEENIEISGVINADDYRRILFWQHKRQLIIMCIGTLFLSLPMLFLVVFMLFSKLKYPIAALIPMLIPILLPPLMLVLILFSIWKIANNGAENSEQTFFIFNQDGFKSTSSLATTQMLWSKFFKIQETKTDFVFYSQKNIFFPVPKRFFENESQIMRLKQTLHENLGEKAKLIK